MNKLDLSLLCDKNYFDSLSIQELKQYAQLIRDYLIKLCSTKSSHLASNLGTIEIFLALKKVFDFDKDLFTFDVGHQIYTYKILTGRYEALNTLREFNGLSGFPDPEESKYDLFKVGHVGCALPLALGLSEAMKVSNKNDKQIVTLIGDGSLTNGATLEALNYISNRKDGKIIIILNDNGMSISKTIPSITKKLSLFATKLNIRGILESRMNKKGYSTSIQNLVRLFQWLKSIILPKQIFEDFGIRYIGPIDGHNIKELIDYFTFAKKFNKTILIHVKTVKGKGFAPAENNPELFHSAPPFDPITGEVKQSSNTFTSYFGKLLVDKAKENKDIYAITAAMKNGCGLDQFEIEFPDRFIDAGIAESLAVSLGAGLAKSGKLPVVAMYSIFLQRAADQVFHDVVLNHLPVFFAIDRAGLVGIDGPTHHGLYIYPFLFSLPDSYLISCGIIDDIEYGLSLIGKIKLPVFMQYPKEKAFYFKDIVKEIESSVNLSLNSQYKKDGISTISDRSKEKYLCILSIGSSINICKKAFIESLNNDLMVDFYYLSLIKPLNIERFTDLLTKYENIIVVEESASSSYIYQKMNEIASELKIKGEKSSTMFSFTLVDKIITHGSREQLFSSIGFSSDRIYDLIKEIYLKKINQKN